MTGDEPIHVGRTLALACAKLLIEGHYKSAIFTALVGYFSSVEAQDEESKAAAVTWLEKAIEEYLENRGDQLSRRETAPISCSFCGLSEPEVRLAAGPNVFICDSCVRNFTTVFARDQDLSE